MDRKITELDSIEQIQGDEYFVIASKQYNENYKVKVSNFIEQMDFIVVDDELSLTSTNPVQNRVITKKLNELDDRLDSIDGGNDSSTNFDLVVASVETETLPAGKLANVEITDLGTVDNVKSLAFSFAIPKGADGAGGSGNGDESFGYRTVFAFKHSVDRPATPVGGSWNAETNEITYPDGWSGSDALERPVWMSNATFDSKGIVTDWSVPFKISGDDGEKGEPGTPGSGGSDGSDSDKAIEFIYKQSNDESDKPSKPANNIYVDDYVPSEEGWNDHPQGVSSTIICEWVCSRSYNKGTGVWNDWEGPVLWSKYGANGKDGDGVEYIYQLSSKYNRPATPGKVAADNSPTTNFQDREFIPQKGTNDEYPWSDNPSDVTADIPYQWVSIRKFNYDNLQWSDFEEPTLWAKYGKDGDEGVGFFKSFVFRRTNTHLTESDRPTGGSYNNPLPKETYWTDGIPSGTEMVWMSSRIFSADGDAPQQDEWSVPAQMTDTADFDVEFSSSVSPAAPKNHPNTTPGWSNTSDETTIWMATSTCSNGVWNEWQVSKIKGEAGDPGTSINIQGSYDSYSALLAAMNAGTLKGNNPPLQGDCYIVNGDLYVWDGDEFINCGNVKGDPGAGIYSITSKYGVSASSSIKPTTWYSTSPATNATDKKYLWKQTYIKFTQVTDAGTDNVVFEEVIGVHGDKGIDGETTEYIFILSNNEDSSAIQVPTSNDPINTNGARGQWSDDALGPGEDFKYEYVSSHVKYYDEATGSMVWGPYGPASHWASYSKDGRGIDYTESSYAIHSKISDLDNVLAALSWQSSSPAVTEDKPYLWKRTLVYFTDGTTSSYSYECIGKMGDAGIDGESVQFAFKLTTDYTVPTSPKTDVEGSNIIGSWTDDPQLLGNYDSNNEWIGTGTGQEIAITYKYQWVSKRTKEQGSDTWGEWGPASLWSELYPGTYLHIKYSNDIENKEFTNNNGEDVGKYIGVLVDYNQGDSADFDDYTWRKFEGNDGFGREYIFKLNNDYNDPPKVPIRQDGDNVPQFEPTGWNLNPVIPTTNNRYCWCCHRDGNGNEWGDWTGNSTNTQYAYLFSMYAESVKGETGQDGPILFPAGYWESGKSYEQILRADGSVLATPYVYDTNDETYYYLIADVQSSTRPANDNIHWEKMTTFNAIYTDILLANNAKVGQAVFNGNYMFSQNGINANGDSTTGTEYQHFNHDNPYLETNTFRPNWCVNLKTGEMWAGTGSSHFAPDGGGYLANELILWTSGGYPSIVLEGTDYVDGLGYKGATFSMNTLSVTSAESKFHAGINMGGGVFYVKTTKTAEDGGALGSYAFQINGDGSGSLAHGNIEWDKYGNLSIGDDSAYFSTGGTGYIANGDIKWRNSQLIIGESSKFSNAVKIDDLGITVTDSDVIYGETNVPTSYDSVEIGSNYITVESISSLNPKLGGSVTITSNGITRYDYLNGETTSTNWPGSSGSSNIQFVSSLPSSPDDNTLYVIV